MKGQKRTTIHDIAKQLNLNASSVSRALNGMGKVSKETLKLIQDTAEELGYKPNKLASNLRKGANQTIGIIVPRINQNYFANVIAGIEEITYQRGYSLIICQSNESVIREIECVNTLIQKQVSCIVISVSADFKDSAHLLNIAAQGIQLIQFDRVAPDLDTLKVINDNKKAAMEAVEHLIQQGYKRIALLEGPQNLSIFKQRKDGYIAAMKKHKLAIEDKLMVPNAWTQELAAEAAEKLLTGTEPPDAIFASTSDFSALGVLQTAAKLQLSVPQQLGICGYSNEDFTKVTNPSITTIDQFSVNIGRSIAELYFHDADSDLDIKERTVTISPRLIIRDSSRRK